MMARVASGRSARLGTRAMIWAAMPATMGLATLVPLAPRPLAVRTDGAGADTFGLLKSPCVFHAVPERSR